MKLLTKNTDYAVRAVLTAALAPKGEYVSSGAIARAQDIPLSFLRVVLRSLIKEGVLKAREGKDGGVMLAMPPQKITLTLLMRIFQGEICLSQCMFRKKICRNRPTCVLRKRLGGLESVLEKEFSRITVAQLMRDLGRKDEKADN